MKKLRWEEWRHEAWTDLFKRFCCKAKETHWVGDERVGGQGKVFFNKCWALQQASHQSHTQSAHSGVGGRPSPSAMKIQGISSMQGAGLRGCAGHTKVLRPPIQMGQGRFPEAVCKPSQGRLVFKKDRSIVGWPHSLNFAFWDFWPLLGGNKRFTYWSVLSSFAPCC